MSLNRQYSKGFTLIEVLVALLILAVGLLGTASLMLMSMQSNQSAAQRSTASLLAYDLAERMRINRGEALSGNYVISSTTTPPTSPNCITTGCTNAKQRDQDIREWQENFTDITDIGADGDDYRPMIAGATYNVTRANTNQYTIAITWTDSGTTLKRASGAAETSSYTLSVEL